MDKLGVGGVIGWIAILLVVFVAIGYIFLPCGQCKENSSLFQAEKTKG